MTTPPRATALLAAAALLLSAAPAAAFEFNAVLWSRDSSPLLIELHNAGVDDLTISDLEAVVQNTIATWNAVPCSWLKLAYGGATDDMIEPVSMRDDRQILEFITDEERWVYGSMTAGAMLADVYDPPETPERELPRVDIAFNGVDFGWEIGGAGIRDVSVLDPESVLTHEVGHLMGLSHTPVSNAATMAAAYLPDLGQQTLAFDDKSGMCAKYWTQGDECDDDGDCPDGQTCDTYTEPESGEQARLCAEQHGTWGDPCSGEELRCEGYCLFTVSDLSDGFCSDLCDHDGEESGCPEGWACQNIQTMANPLYFCRVDDSPPPEPEPDVGDMDSSSDDTGSTDDTNTSPDTDAPDTGSTDPDAAIADASPSDSGAGADTAASSGGGDGGGCQSAPGRASGGAAWLVVLGALVAWWNTRR